MPKGTKKKPETSDRCEAKLGELLLILAEATLRPEHGEGRGLSACLLPGAYSRTATPN